MARSGPNGKKAHLEHGSKSTRRPLRNNHAFAKPAGERAKKGRRPKLTKSEKRKLARLYVGTQLPTEDICRVLRKLHGKSISVRCAQNNIQDVLQTYPLLSARPLDRAECRSRTEQIKHFGETAVVGFPQNTTSQEPTSPRNAYQIPISDNIGLVEMNSEFEDPEPGHLPLDTNDFHHQAFEWLWSMPLDAGLPKVSPGAAWLPTTQHDAPGSGGAVLYGDLAFDQYQPEPSDHPAISYGSTMGGVVPTTGSVLLPGPPLTDTAGVNIGSEIIEEPNDENPKYHLGFGHGTIFPSLQLASFNYTDEYEHVEVLQPPFDISAEMKSSTIEIAPLEPDIPIYGTGASHRHMRPGSFSVPCGKSRDFQTEAVIGPPIDVPTNRDSETTPRDIEISNVHCAPDLVGDESRVIARESGTPGLGSLRRCLSGSSSQCDDIVTLFSCCSVSSKGTKQTNSTLSTLDALEGILESKRRETTFDIIYEIESLANAASDVFVSITDTPTVTGGCSKCWLVHASTICSCDSVPLKPDIEDYQGFRDSGSPKFDRFNNTALHVIAALGGDNDSLFDLARSSRNLNAVNTAGQTFLHMINADYLTRLETDLPAFLSLLSDLGFIFERVDCQGVNVLQALLHHTLHHDTINRIFEKLNVHESLITSRDCFGRTCLSRLGYLHEEAKKQDSRRCEALNDLLQNLRTKLPLGAHDKVLISEPSQSRSDVDPESTERLLDQFATKPCSEDGHGRNGLHYLAAARLEIRHATSEVEREPALTQGQLRHRHLVRLIDVGVNVNSYDMAGDTPLHAFLYSRHVAAQVHKDDGDIRFYLTRLIMAGALVDNRNREGESPLHVAIKLGIISAIKTLISLGANIHAQQKDRRGVVKVGLEAAQSIQQSRKKQKSLQIRILTCVSIARSHGAVEYPTSLQEWTASKLPEAK